MGRSAYSYIPRAYCFLPSFVAPNAASGTDVVAPLSSPPFGIGPDAYLASTRRPFVPVYLGVGWSGAITDNGTTTVGIGNKVSGVGTVHYLTKNFDTLSTSLIANGYAYLGYADETTAQRWDSAATKNRHDNLAGVGSSSNKNLSCFCDVDSGDANYLAANYLCSPGGLYDTVGVSHDPDTKHLRTGKSYHRGPVAGCLASVTLHDLDAASGQTDLDLREIEMPFSMRVHAVLFFSSASGASNVVSIYNQSETEVVASDATLVGAAEDNVTLHHASLTNRDITKGDKLRLRVTTVGTGFTRVGAILIGHVTAHPDLTRLIHYSSSAVRPSTGVGNHDSIGSDVSGPGLGSIVPLYMGRANLASGQTAATIVQMALPFDCEVLAIATYAAAIASAADSLSVLNTTEGVTLTNAISSPGQVANIATWWLLNATDKTLNSGGDNLKCSRGDVIELQGTTAVAGGYTDASAILLVRPTGFPHDDPEND